MCNKVLNYVFLKWCNLIFVEGCNILFNYVLKFDLYVIVDIYFLVKLFL